jgi:hypothetical protein
VRSTGPQWRSSDLAAVPFALHVSRIRKILATGGVFCDETQNREIVCESLANAYLLRRILINEPKQARTYDRTPRKIGAGHYNRLRSLPYF